MPTTRSRAAKQIVRAESFDSEVQRVETSSSENDSMTPSTAIIEEHLKQAQLGLGKFKQQLQLLRKENKSLKSKLASAKESSQKLVSKTCAIASESEDDMNLEQIHVQDLRGKVQQLQEEVNKLTYENQRQQKRIQKFKRKELEQEVQDLVGKKGKKPADPEEMDPEYRMRKLLRKFSDLMSVSTIPEDMSQECPICYERLELGKCSALGCQHLICHDCLPKMSKGADETVECAECRSFSSRDEIELVHMTEQDRFDKLLEVAQAWDAWDQRRGEETSEEEAEESFINDETGTNSEVGNESRSTDGDHPPSEAVQPASGGDDNPPTPPPRSSRLFSESPAKEKRKRLEQLVEERTQKRRR